MSYAGWHIAAVMHLDAAGAAQVLIDLLPEPEYLSDAAAARLRELCERDLPELNRHVLSKVMDWLGTPEALAANLNLIDDARPSAVPQGIRDQLESAFVEQRP